MVSSISRTHQPQAPARGCPRAGAWGWWGGSNAAALDGQLALVDQAFEVIAAERLRRHALARHLQLRHPGDRVQQQRAEVVVGEIGVLVQAREAEAASAI